MARRGLAVLLVVFHELNEGLGWKRRQTVPQTQWDPMRHNTQPRMKCGTLEDHAHRDTKPAPFPATRSTRFPPFRDGSFPGVGSQSPQRTGQGDQVLASQFSAIFWKMCFWAPLLCPLKTRRFDTNLPRLSVENLGPEIPCTPASVAPSTGPRPGARRQWSAMVGASPSPERNSPFWWAAGEQPTENIRCFAGPTSFHFIIKDTSTYKPKAGSPKEQARLETTTTTNLSARHCF